MHRPGIEPGPPAWQASILPLNQRCFHSNSSNSTVVDKNHYFSFLKNLPQSVGFEPTLPEGN